jgi:hypothetical protein
VPEKEEDVLVPKAVGEITDSLANYEIKIAMTNNPYATFNFSMQYSIEGIELLAFEGFETETELLKQKIEELKSATKIKDNMLVIDKELANSYRKNILLLQATEIRSEVKRILYVAGYYVREKAKEMIIGHYKTDDIAFFRNPPPKKPLQTEFTMTGVEDDDEY